DHHNYYTTFTTSLEYGAEPLQNLLASSAVWRKGKPDSIKRHLNALRETKLLVVKLMDSDNVLALRLRIQIQFDASPVGISAILSQKTKGMEDDKVISYASRALTDVEKRYSQTEKEALAIVWGAEHFHLYLYGKDFTLVTDHKPLEVIYGNKRAKSSARIERWVLRLQPYSFKVIYRPGVTNPADYLSRHPTQTSCKQQKMTEGYVNFIASNSVPKAMTMDEIVTATDSDRVLKGVRAAIKLNKWDYDIVKPYKAIKDEITVTSKGLILRGTRIVLPQSLQQRAIDLAHESHLGLSKTKALLREKIWFPNIDKLVKSTLERCLPCQAVGKPPPPEPLAMTEMPKGPWEMVHLDFYGPLPTGEYLLVVIDRYSRYPEVEIVRSTKASTVIPKLDKIFATHGIPSIVKSDNGPPFNGEEYRRYLETLGIKPEFSTPYWPQGNAEAERFMQPLGKALKTAHLQGRPWQQELSRFLLQYRTAPHTSKGVAPSELLFNRTVKGKLPVLKKRNVVNKHKQARANESKKQQYNKVYADHRRNVRTSDIRIGNCVLVRQERQNKLTSRFNTTPYTVTTRNKSKVTARSRHTITRNVSHFKRIPKQYESDTDDERTTVNNDQGQNETGDNQDQLPVVPTRRSGRERRIPERYGQPLSWTLNL
ncbi:uncharacterized protein K02A2.6-like, partial [Paramuricea clavata]